MSGWRRPAVCEGLAWLHVDDGRCRPERFFAPSRCSPPTTTVSSSSALSLCPPPTTTARAEEMTGPRVSTRRRTGPRRIFSDPKRSKKTGPSSNQTTPFLATATPAAEDAPAGQPGQKWQRSDRLRSKQIQRKPSSTISSHLRDLAVRTAFSRSAPVGSWSILDQPSGGTPNQWGVKYGSDGTRTRDLCRDRAAL